MIAARRLWMQFFGIKTDRETTREAQRNVLSQPLAKNALRTVRRSERLLASLEALEGKKKHDE